MIFVFQVNKKSYNIGYLFYFLLNKIKIFDFFY